LEVYTAGIPHATTDATISVKLVGDEGATDWMLITDKGFEKGQVKKQDVKAQLVGALDEMFIKVEPADKQWICHKIIVMLQYRVWQFICPGIIRGDKETSIVASGFSQYNFKVKSTSATTGMIIGQLTGTNGKTGPPFILSDNGFNQGS